MSSPPFSVASSPPAGRKKTVFVAALGDSNVIETWSGIPYHFLAAAREGGLADSGLPLEASGWQWRARRIAWNAAQILSGDRPGGYQYSVAFLERLWRGCSGSAIDNVVINCFQLFPPSLVADRRVEKWFFLDQTLIQNFDHYGVRQHIGRRIAARALAREKEGYEQCTGIVGHSRWAADSVVRDYGIDARKVHVALPGANLHPVEYARWEASRGPTAVTDRPLRLVFVGKDWRRKGLDRLLLGLRWARAAGSRVSLRVMGCPRELLPADLADVDGVEWYGFVDKRSEPQRFIAAVGDCDVGCLLSRAEAGGIALREYHALGLAVIGTEAGGSPEHAVAEASIFVPIEASPADIGRMLVSLERDPQRLQRLRQAAWENRRQMMWESTVRVVKTFFRA